MYRKILIFFMLNICLTLFSQEDIKYFLPLDEKYNDDIPKPNEILGFNIGDWHINHDKLFDYFPNYSFLFWSYF